MITATTKYLFIYILYKTKEQTFVWPRDPNPHLSRHSPALGHRTNEVRPARHLGVPSETRLLAAVMYGERAES